MYCTGRSRWPSDHGSSDSSCSLYSSRHSSASNEARKGSIKSARCSMRSWQATAGPSRLWPSASERSSGRSPSTCVEQGIHHVTSSDPQALTPSSRRAAERAPRVVGATPATGRTVEGADVREALRPRGHRVRRLRCRASRVHPLRGRARRAARSACSSIDSVKIPRSGRPRRRRSRGAGSPLRAPAPLECVACPSTFARASDSASAVRSESAARWKKRSS
jgi:hypothetical protein